MPANKTEKLKVAEILVELSHRFLDKYSEEDESVRECFRAHFDDSENSVRKKVQILNKKYGTRASEDKTTMQIVELSKHRDLSTTTTGRSTSSVSKYTLQSTISLVFLSC